MQSLETYLKSVIKEESDKAECDLTDATFCMDCGKEGDNVPNVPFCLGCFNVRLRAFAPGLDVYLRKAVSTWKYIVVDSSEYLPVNSSEEIEYAKERLREEDKTRAAVYECPEFEDFVNTRCTSVYIFA